MSQRPVLLSPGDPAPWFRQRAFGNPDFVFDSVAGRYLVLLFMGSSTLPQSAAALKRVFARPYLFDDKRAAFFGISNDPSDEAGRRLADRYPGYRFFWDFDLKVATLYGVAGETKGEIRPAWFVLDPRLRIIRVLPLTADGAELGDLMALLENLPPVDRFAGIELQAPILFLPDVFEPSFCRRLIAMYEEHGGQESGFMREIDGKTTLVTHPGHKRRRDFIIEDPDVLAMTRGRILRRVVPEIRKAHQFEVTRMERYIVSCYDAAEGGHFRAHRDNTTKGTAHRRFAVSINLNSEFEGGEVSFPEYGSRSFKPPPGGAVVFSCSLLHQVSPVTEGRRFAFLPFLYDEAAARIREENNQHLDDGIERYKAS